MTAVTIPNLYISSRATRPINGRQARNTKAQKDRFFCPLFYFKGTF